MIEHYTKLITEKYKTIAIEEKEKKKSPLDEFEKKYGIDTYGNDR